jgi:hypothetical protein
VADRHQAQSVKGPVAAGFIVSAALLVDQSWLLAGASLALAGLVVLRKW